MKTQPTEFFLCKPHLSQLRNLMMGNTSIDVLGVENRNRYSKKRQIAKFPWLQFRGYAREYKYNLNSESCLLNLWITWALPVWDVLICVCGGAESQAFYIESFLICWFVTYYLLGGGSGSFLVRNTFFSFLGLIKKCETVCKEQNLIFCHISNVAITGFYVEYVLLSWQIIMGNYLFSKERNHFVSVTWDCS